MKKLLATLVLSVMILSGCNVIEETPLPSATPYPADVP